MGEAIVFTSGKGGVGKTTTIANLSLIHISEPTRLRRISYAVFCLQKKKDGLLSRMPSSA